MNTRENESPLPAGVGDLLVRHYRELLRFLERRVGRRDVAEDILHDTFAQTIAKVGTLRDSAAFLPWFKQALRNRAVDHHRRAKRIARTESELTEQVDGAMMAPLEAPSAESCSCVSRLVTTLKHEHADALRRIEVEGSSLQRFADEHGISKSNAAVRVFRAREALRKKLVGSCGTSAPHGCASCTCGEDEVAVAAVADPREGSECTGEPGRGKSRGERRPRPQ